MKCKARINLVFFVLLIFVILSCTRNRESSEIALFRAKYLRETSILLESLNLDYPGLENIKEALENHDTTQALHELVSYYAKSPINDFFTKETVQYPIAFEETGTKYAISALSDTFTIQGIKNKQKRLDNGFIDWAYQGPNNDKEWGYFINRHYFFLTLLSGYWETGSDEYVQYFDNSIKDWIIHNPPPDTAVKTLQWRVMECGSRMLQTWPQAYYGFMRSPAFSISARLLMLSQIPAHAEYLRKYHYTHHNHAVKEMCGLESLAIFWPEFKSSGSWYDYAVKQILEELEFQVYPDGTHKELSGHYHKNVAIYFKDFVSIARRGNKPLPKTMEEKIMDMADYMARTMRPSGHGLNNNDSDLDQIEQIIAKDADAYGRPDWEFIASNGLKGVSPGYSSSVFPYAGHLIMRDNWGASSNWGYFDFGPWGTAHQHNDKLHVSITVAGKDFLVDAGRYIYGDDPYRDYFIGTTSHNTITINGKNQNAQVLEVPSPVPKARYETNDEYDFAVGTFRDGYKNIDAIHHRAVFYKKSKYWLIVDCISGPDVNTITNFWHFHPDCEVAYVEDSIYSKNGSSDLLIIPLKTSNKEVKLFEGSEDPIQGWWSKAYNHKEPAKTVVYNQERSDNLPFGWLLIPMKDPDFMIELGKITTTKNQFIVHIDGREIKIGFDKPPYLIIR